MSQHPGHGRRPLPPIPASSIDMDEAHDALRRAGSQAAAGNGLTRGPEDDVPAGKVWTPGPEDHVSRKDKQHLQIPDFIPVRLSQATGAQRDIAASVIQDQIDNGTRAADDIPEQFGGRPQPQQQQPQGSRRVPADFDPEVDDADEVYGGPEANHPQNLSQADALRNSVLAKQAARKTEQRNPQATAAKSPEDRARDIAAERPALMAGHPVLQKLRARYGIASLDVRTKTVDGFTYGFRKYSNQAYLKFVTNMVMPTIETQEELRDKHGYALAAISIVSIDGVPAWEVMGIELDPIAEAPLVREHPLDVPVSVTLRTAEAMYTWFISLGIPEFGDTLAKLYLELFPEQDLVNDVDHWIYSCPQTGCQERLVRVPEYDADGTMVPRYCPTHGVKMTALGSKRELGDIPLA